MEPLRLQGHDAPYAQLVEQIGEQVRTGQLAPGEKLSPVRRLAAQLELAPGTVARAYRELEQLGLVEGRGRAGTVVTGDSAVTAARAAAHDFAAQMRKLGVPNGQALELARAALDS